MPNINPSDFNEKDKARFAKFVQQTDGCWLWSGSKSPKGYGYFYVLGRLVVAHRVAWMMAHARPIPDGLQIDHLCRNRSCVNPAHLEPVSSRENTLRGEGISAKYARRSVCKRGHPLPTDVPRVCLECQRMNGREAYTPRPRGPHKLTAEGRARIVEAQRRRWAK